MHSVQPELVRQVVEGQYEIDPHAVAEAMLRRSARLTELQRLSRMLVAADLNRPAGRPKKK